MSTLSKHAGVSYRGVLQGCETLDQCVLALATAVTRRVLPQPGKVYMENKPIKSLKEHGCQADREATFTSHGWGMLGQKGEDLEGMSERGM